MHKIALPISLIALALNGTTEASIVLVPNGTAANDTVIHNSNQLGIIDCEGKIIVEELEGPTANNTEAIGVETSTGPLLNKGMITVTADTIFPTKDPVLALAYGMYYLGDYGTLTSCGMITVTANSQGGANNGTAISSAYGMYHLGGYGALNNSGAISAIADALIEQAITVSRVACL
jgi:hypothetical protein